MNSIQKSCFFRWCIPVLIITTVVFFPGTLSSSLYAQPAEPLIADRPASLSEDRLIYLPFDKFDSALEDPNAKVVLPLKQYLQLKKQAEASAIQSPNGDAIDAVITKAAYLGKVDEKLVRITATYHINVYGEDWAEVPVEFGQAAVSSVKTAEGKGEVLLRGMGNGCYSLLLSEKGEHIVNIELVSRITTSPDGRSFDLQIPSVGVTTFDFTVPEPNQTISISPNIVTIESDDKGANNAEKQKQPNKQPMADQNSTRVQAVLGSTERVNVRWHLKAGLKPQMDLLSNVVNSTLVTLAEGRVQTDTYLQYQILRGTLNQFKIAVPLDHEIRVIDVANATLKGWQKKEDAATKQQVVTVELVDAVSNSFQVEIHTSRKIPQGIFPVAGFISTDDTKEWNGIHALDVVRESGQLVVVSEESLAMTIKEQDGLSRIDAAEVNAKIRKPRGMNFKFYNPAFRLKLSVERIQPLLIAHQTAQLVYSEDELRLTSVLNYIVERAGVFEFQLKVPAELQINQVNGGGVLDYDLDQETNVVTVRLTGKRMGNTTVTLTAHQELKKENDQTSISLPIPELMGVERETGHIEVYAPSSHEVITKLETEKGVTPAPVQPRTLGLARLVAAWDYHAPPVKITSTTKQKPTRLSASVGTELHLNPGQAEVRTLLAYLVEHAGVDTFRIAVPAEFSEKASIETVPIDARIQIKQITKETGEEGWVVHTIVLQDKVQGVQQFQVVYTMQSETSENDSTDAASPKPKEEQPTDESNRSSSRNRELTIHPVRVLGLEAEQHSGVAVPLSSMKGEMIVTHDRSLSIRATNQSKTPDSKTPLLEQIDPRHLQFLTKNRFDQEQRPTEDSRTLSLSWRYFQQPVSATMEIIQHEVQRVIETVVAKGLVEVIVGRDPVVTYRCRYQMRSSERQRLRIDFPQQMTILGVEVNRQSSALEVNQLLEPEEGWTSYFLNVGRTGGADDLFTVTLLFQAPLEGQPFRRNGGRLEFRLPRIGDPAGKSIAVQQLKTVVWIPTDFAIVQTPDTFERELAPRFRHLFLMGSLMRDQDTYDLENWIEVPVGGSLDFPTTGHHAYRYSSLGSVNAIQIQWWTIWFAVAVLSGAVLLIGLVLMATSWQTRIGLLLLALFLSGLYALVDSELVIHAFAAAQWGLWIVLGLWILRTLFTSWKNVSQQPFLKQFDSRSRRDTETDADRRDPPGPPGTVIPPPGVFEEFRSLYS